MLRRCAFALFLPLAALPLYSQGQATSSASNAPVANAGVQVSSQGNQLQVKVPEQAPLSDVLSSVCREQKIKCTGIETLTTYRGPAMSVDGTLRQVISKLLEGTDVNYEFSRAAEGGATAIAFLGHAPHGTAAVPAPPGIEKPDHPPLLHSRPFPGKPPQEAAPPSNPPQSQVLPANPSEGSEPTTAPTSAAQNEAAAKYLVTGSGDKTPPKYLPFPDQNGNPVPVSKTPVTVLPFPDQNGKPIPVKPSQGGSPFPATSNAQSSDSSKQ